MNACSFYRATPNASGAIGCIQLCGDVTPVMSAITGCDDWHSGVVKLVRFADIDNGIAFMLDDNHAVLMPHGGELISRKLVCALIGLQCRAIRSDDDDLHDLFPEAHDRIEQLMLCAVSRLQSSLGLDLLLDQPGRWRSGRENTADCRARSARLNRFFAPPLVVVAGPANVGKSTLSNLLVGRTMSIEADAPGTTRDYVAAKINLAGLVVNWIDTPGVRDNNDPIECAAAERANTLIENADLLISLTDHEQPWLSLRRDPDIRVANKSDISHRSDADFAISALAGDGIDRLVRDVRELLVSDSDLESKGLWLFDERLESLRVP